MAPPKTLSLRAPPTQLLGSEASIFLLAVVLDKALFGHASAALALMFLFWVVAAVVGGADLKNHVFKAQLTSRCTCPHKPHPLGLFAT